MRVVFEYAGGECEGVSDLGKFDMFVWEVLGMRIMMSERSDGVRSDTVHRNSAEQCSRTVSFFFFASCLPNSTSIAGHILPQVCTSHWQFEVALASSRWWFRSP